MSRPIRVDVEGGWYHISARGIERRTIFGDEREHKHFLELLAGMGERYSCSGDMGSGDMGTNSGDMGTWGHVSTSDK
jgi:hypothetical protein